MNSGNCEEHNLGYTTVEMLLDDVSKQMASSNLSRYSRGSAGQKMGGSMRVVKPTSTSNSPRGSAGLGRRRTVMADGAYRRRLAMMDQNVAAGGMIQNEGLQLLAHPTRPVSWHPSSHLAPQPVYQGAYQVPTPEINNQFQVYDLFNLLAIIIAIFRVRTINVISTQFELISDEQQLQYRPNTLPSTIITKLRVTIYIERGLIYVLPL